MGQVYLVRHVRTGGLFALKTLLLDDVDPDSEVYRRFQSEALTVSQLRHPGIVQVTDFNRDEDGTPFMIMEFLEGEELGQRLDRVGKLTVAQVKEIVEQLASALQAAHDSGVIHRDVKPQNIFLVRQLSARGVSESAKILDFGISKIRRSRSQMTRDQAILGTPEYMSPEAAIGEHSQIDGRSDQFSLATMMYYFLTGQQAFAAPHPMAVLYRVVNVNPPDLRQLAPEVPASLAQAIARGMSKKKEDRFPTMLDFVRAACEIEPTSSPLFNPSKDIDSSRQPPGQAVNNATITRASWYQIQHRSNQKRYAAVLAGFAALAVLSLIMFGFGHRIHRKPEPLLSAGAGAPPSVTTTPTAATIPSAANSAPVLATENGVSDKKAIIPSSDPGKVANKEEEVKQGLLPKKKGTHPPESTPKVIKKNELPATKRPDYHPTF